MIVGGILLLVLLAAISIPVALNQQKPKSTTGGSASSGAPVAAPAGTSETSQAPEDYPATQAGLDRAIRECADEVIVPEQFAAANQSVMQAAVAIDDTVAAVGECVTEKNPVEYHCAPADNGTGVGGSTVCAYKKYLTTGTLLEGTEVVRSALHNAGSPGY